MSDEKLKAAASDVAGILARAMAETGATIVAAHMKDCNAFGGRSLCVAVALGDDADALHDFVNACDEEEPPR